MEGKATVAKARHQSLNKLVQDGLKSIELQQREEQLFDDFTAIAESGREATSVDFAFQAQTEAIASS